MPLLMPRAKVRQRGTTAFTLISTSVNVTLSQPMPTTDYDVFYRLQSGISVSVAVSNQTRTGFTLGVGLGIATTIEWVAIEK